jgi:hypothetical protein
VHRIGLATTLNKKEGEKNVSRMKGEKEKNVSRMIIGLATTLNKQE